MTIKTTYQNVKDNYPNTLKVLESKLRKGRSKYKNSLIKDFKYSFIIAERIEGTSLSDILSGNPEEKEETIDEVVERRVKNSFAYIQMKTPTAIYSESIDTLPREAEESYREGEEESRAEDERINSLSDEEQKKEIDELLNELTNMGGFFGIR